MKMRMNTKKIMSRSVAGLLAAVMCLTLAGTYSEEYVITEQHDLPVEMADGVFTGNGSDCPIGGPGEYEADTPKRLFNILEILPTEKRAVVGYTIGGCEPFDVADPEEIKTKYKTTVTTKQLKEACVDALINKEPDGDDQANQSSVLNNGYGKFLWDIDQKMGYETVFKFETGKTYSGYYKYVGPNNGVYKIDNPKKINQKVYSKFYRPKSESGFDYIFIYDDPSPEGETKNVPVEHEKRVRCINKEKLITTWLGKSVGDKQNIDFEVTTRTPVSVSYKDIERADLILLNNATQGTDQYYYALRLKNAIENRNPDYNQSGLGADWDKHYYSPEEDGTIKTKANRIDFNDFEKVIRIYERVVVRQDVGFVAEKNCCTYRTGGGSFMEINQINTNLRKLMFMLFYIQIGKGENAKKQRGRDLFSDYFKRYTDEPGFYRTDSEDSTDTGERYINLRRLHFEDPKHYPVDYRANTLVKNKNATPDQPEYYYMHVTAGAAHVGHPLVLDKTTAISGVRLNEYTYGGKTIYLPEFDNGKMIPLHNQDPYYNKEHILEREEPDMFQDAGIPYQGEVNSDADAIEGQGYKIGDRYKYKYAYESMSNMTDYIYIDNDGRLVIDKKYSSDPVNTDYRNYWYKIDQDDHISGYDYRRRKWQPEVYDMDDEDNPRPWPWDSSADGNELTVWLMHKSTNSMYDCNLHMWYDYFQFVDDKDKYYTSKQAPFGVNYNNQSLMEENGFFQNNWIKDALKGREIKREDTDDLHVSTETNKKTRKYYFSMNIVNGDSVTRELSSSTNKNKTMYLNRYEIDKMDDGSHALPLNIEMVTSHKITAVTITHNTDSKTFNSSSGILKGGGSLGDLTLTDKTEYVDGKAPYDSGGDYYKYTLTGTVTVPKNWYKTGSNNVIKVKATNEIGQSVEDMITVVTRDFFGLN